LAGRLATLVGTYGPSGLLARHYRLADLTAQHLRQLGEVHRHAASTSGSAISYPSAGRRLRHVGNDAAWTLCCAKPCVPSARRSTSVEGSRHQVAIVTYPQLVN